MNISIPQKNDWPPTIDGTTDWQTLFEHKQKGLIAIIMATQTPAQLKQQTEGIIRAIYNRKRDQLILGKVTAFLDKLIPEDASIERLPVMQASVRQLFGKIKETRIERAAAYVEKKARKGPRKKSGKKNNRRPNLLVGFFRRSADALVFLVGLVTRVKDATKVNKEDGEEIFFKQDAYVDHGGDGNTEWQDSDVSVKESKTVKPGIFDDAEEEEEDQKYESWDDY